MISIKTLCIAASAALVLPSIAMADNFVLDPAHTQTVFTISHLGYSTITGSFRDLKGTLVFDPKKIEDSSIDVTIGVASVDTGFTARDNVLQSKAFFDAADFPVMEFKSTRVQATGEQFADVQGDLTLLGVTKPVVLKVTLNRIAPDQMRNNAVVVGFTGITTLKRSDFGMKAYLPYIGDDVKVAINFEGVQQK